MLEVLKTQGNTSHCKCFYGKEFILNNKRIKAGQKSCGCLKNKPKHGMLNSKEYSSWQHMKSRCYNKKQNNYKDYGGRGITVCDEWKDSFANFYRDMGDMPEDCSSLDRKDVNGNYCKSNCKWATREEQDNNTRNNRFITVNGKTLTIAQWSRETGVSQVTISGRLRRGWSEENSITVPVHSSNKYLEKQG